MSREKCRVPLINYSPMVQSLPLEAARRRSLLTKLEPVPFAGFFDDEVFRSTTAWKQVIRM